MPKGSDHITVVPYELLSCNKQLKNSTVCCVLLLRVCQDVLLQLRTYGRSIQHTCNLIQHKKWKLVEELHRPQCCCQYFFDWSPTFCAVLSSYVHQLVRFLILSQLPHIAVLYVQVIRPGYICGGYFAKFCTAHLVV